MNTGDFLPSRRSLMMFPAGLGATAATMVLGSASALGARVGADVRKLTPKIRALAAKWAKEYKIPLQWILATILAESGGDPNETGDYKNGIYRSLGLMQINRVANADLLKKFGVVNPGQQLFDPNINIMLGAYLLREAWARVYRESLGRQAPGKLDELVRFSYVGPVPTVRALRAGKHPKDVFSDGPLLASVWAQALSDTRTLV
jgi:hypothetical protein